MAQPSTDARTHPVLPPRPLDERSGRREHRTPLAWLPWALLAALLALLLVTALVAFGTGEDEPASTAGSTGAGTAGGGGRASGAGSLSVGSLSVLQDAGTLSRLRGTVGETATGRDLAVQEVVADEGFWVGSTAASRVFVFLTPQARQSTGESGFQVRAGQSVDLTGTVTAVRAGDPARLGVTGAEGARQLGSQGAYVSATRVALSR